MPIKRWIRTIPDYPKPGIQFRDITTLLLDPEGVQMVVEHLAEPFRGAGIQKVAAVEARGFIFGVAVALRLGAGFVPVRKPGKLPGPVIGEDYTLEYGTDRVEMHDDALRPGERVLLVDDLIATGGTAEAAVKLLAKVGAEVAGCAFAIELPALGGRTRLEKLGHRVLALCEFEGD